MVVKIQIIHQKFRSRHAAVAPLDTVVATQVIVEVALNPQTPRSFATNAATPSDLVEVSRAKAKAKVADIEAQVRRKAKFRLLRARGKDCGAREQTATFRVLL